MKPARDRAPSLVLDLFSFGNLTRAKRTALGEVFDAHPALRPARIGEDPPRTLVGDSFVPHLAAPNLPLWLIGAQASRAEVATWFFDFYPEWKVVSRRDGTERVMRSMSTLTIFVGPERILSAGGSAGLGAFFAELGDAFGAAYGCIFPEQFYDKLDAWYPDSGNARPHPSTGLGSVYWMQYFGPAFCHRYPALHSLPLAEITPRGATIYRATEHPDDTLMPEGGPLDGAWREPLVSVLGAETFHPDLSERAALPVSKDHASYDPESKPAPADLVERLAQEARERQERRATGYARAHQRRVRLESRRAQPSAVDASHEWSTNLDYDQAARLWKALRTSLAPEISGPYASALGRELTNAPYGTTGEVALDSAHGAFAFSWWADDDESLVVAVQGPPAVIERIEKSIDYD